MEIQKLAQLLRDSYDQAPKGNKSIAVCLFGVRFADEIGSSTNAIMEAAMIGDYGPEVRKGIKLARYVNLKAGL